MEIFRKILLYFNLLSLDVVLGSMGGMLFFTEFLEVKVSASVYFLLGMAVWSIYTLDHLLDARSTLGKPQTRRHQFHQKYFWILLPFVVSSILIGSVLVLSASELKFLQIPGIVLGTGIVVWMGFLKLAGPKLSWLKEISTAFIYVAGISLAPFASMDFELVDKNFFLFVFIYFLAALVNLLMLSYLDAVEDQKDGFGSVLVLISKNRLKKLIVTIGMFGIVLLVILVIFLPSFYHIHSVILVLIIGYHLILFFSQNQNKDQIRIKSEALFLLPFLLLLF